jgi:hypothetical protein
MSDHSLALVPVDAGYHQSTDLFARGRPIDTGLLAEALIYYDRVLLHVTSPIQFSQLISWLVQQGLTTSDIIALLRDEVLRVYNFAFTTNPYVDFEPPDGIQVHGLYNFQDQVMSEPNSFFKRFVEFEPLRECFENRDQYEEFARALEGRVVEVKAEDIGREAIDNAYKDFLNPDRSALMAQELVNEIYRAKRLGKPPQILVKIKNFGGGDFNVDWNFPLNRLPALEADTNIKAAVTLPLSTAAQANKYLWAAQKEKCDLYLSRPVSVLVGDKLFEAEDAAVKAQIKPQNIIEQLELKVEFPDLRRHVNLDKIDFAHVLRIRNKAKTFRRWLQSEGDRDRDAIVAYHREVARESGFANIARRGWRVFGVVGGAAVGGAVLADPAIGAAVGAAGGAAVQAAAEESVKYLFDLSASIGTKWSPVVFGDWYSTKIANLLKE